MGTDFHKEPVNAEVLIEGLTRELHHDGKLLILNFTERMSRKVVDKFYDTYVEYGKSMGSQERFVVYDFHKSHIAVTPYLGEKVNQLNEEYPGETGRISMAIPLSPIRNILRFFVRRRQHTQPDLEFEFFETREQAIQWVENLLKEKEVSV